MHTSTVLYGGQEHVFKTYFLTNEEVTSQHKNLKNLHKDLTR